MVEKRLDKIGTCLICGTSRYETFLNRDHAFPQSMANKPELRGNIRNPFWDVVYNRRNVFKMCKTHHLAVDAGKTQAFSQDGFVTLDPVGLVTYLMEEYPITENEKYRCTQLANMIDTINLFVKVVDNLDGEFPRSLVREYHNAAEVAGNFKIRLEEKRNFQCEH